MSTIHEFGPFQLDADAGILFHGGEPLLLGERAIALLRLLVERPGAPVSKDALIAGAWPGLVVEDSNLTVQIAALRRVFEEVVGGARWIETLPRRGYRYVGPAVASRDRDRQPSLETPTALALPRKPSLAVLPFANLSGDPEQEYFADGIVDDIVTGLSRIKWLFVIARNSTFTYRGRTVDLKQVGREMGVRYVLQGSVRRDADRVRVTGQLIDVTTGAHVCAERYDRKYADIFALQDEIALSVVGAIEPSLRQAEIERAKRKRPDSLDAYDLYLRALPHSRTAMPGDADKALALLRQALALQPDYPAAHAAAAWCHEVRYMRGGLQEADKEAAL